MNVYVRVRSTTRVYILGTIRTFGPISWRHYGQSTFQNVYCVRDDLAVQSNAKKSRTTENNPHMVSQTKRTRSSPYDCSSWRSVTPELKVSLRSKEPIKNVKKKSNHHRPSLIISFSWVKRVVGSQLNFQNAVNTCAVKLIALDKTKSNYVKRFVFWKNPKPEFIEIQKKIRGFYFRVPFITLSMFYWHDTTYRPLGSFWSDEL